MNEHPEIVAKGSQSPPGHAHSGQPDILYLAQGSNRGALYSYDMRSCRFNEAVMAKCQAESLICQGLGIHNAQQFEKILEAHMPRLGFVLWSNRIRDAHGIWKLIQQTGLPIAEYDETGKHTSPTGHPSAHPSVSPGLVLTVPGRSSGHQIASKLFSKGHRHLAFLSPYHMNIWSIERLAGMRDACDKAGAGYTIDAYLPVQEGWNASHGEQKVAGMHYFPVLPAMTKAGLRKRGSDDLDVDMLYRLNVYLNKVAQREDMQLMLLPAMRAAMENSRITAWVCANDFVALQALVFFRRQGIPCPETIAVVGYDNLPEAQEAGLTSFDLDLEADAAHMVDFLSHPSAPSAWHFLQAQGTLVERNTA